MREILGNQGGDKTIIVLRSRSAVRRFLESLPQAPVPHGETHGIGLGRLSA
jgi:hypothetical protein